MCRHIGALLEPTGQRVRSYTQSELIWWYLKKGLVASNVTKTYRYKKKPVFEEFVMQATESRRQSDSDPSLALHASMAKMSVNSVYGKTITNK